METTKHLTDIGKRIAEIRQSKQITQSQLADFLHVTPKHISHVECGTSSLSLANIVKLCDFFQCSLDYLLLGRDHSLLIDRLPEDITKILNSGTEKEINRLYRYLEMYIELTQKQQD